MPRFSRLLASLGLVLLGAIWAPAAAAAGIDARASYIISLGGINLASADIALKDDGKSFAIDLDANVAGMGQFVASGTAEASASGLSGATGFQSQNFALHTRANGEDFSVKVSYAAGAVTAFVVDPPLVDNIDRVPIERAQLTKVSDMLSGFVLKGATLDKSLCNRKLQIFTGVERFDLRFVYTGEDVATSPRTGYQGPVVLCNIRYTPISGHFTTSQITNYLKDSDRILIWYAPVGQTGYFIPYRVLMTTSIGDLSMVLTHVE